MRRIKGLIIAYGIVYIVIPIIIYILDQLNKIPPIHVPPWIYYSCCGSGIIFFILTYFSGSRLFVNIQKRIDAVDKAVNVLVKNMNENPVETKKIYLELKEAIHKYRMLNILQSQGDKQLELKYNIALELAEKLYGQKNIDQQMIEAINRKIWEIDEAHLVQAAELFYEKYIENKDETWKLYNSLIGTGEISLEAFEHSRQLFGNILLIDKFQIYKIGVISKECSEAMEYFIKFMNKNPGKTKSIYSELIYSMSLGNLVEVYNLLEKLYGKKSFSYRKETLAIIKKECDKVLLNIL